MRSSWGILAAVSGHLAGRQASAAPGHHSLPVRTLQTLAQREPVRLKKLSAPDNGILELTLERPEVKNAISWELMTRLRGAIHKIEADATAKVVLVASSVPGVFCAGADLKERRHMSSSQVKEYANSLRSTFSYFEALSIPTIAVIEGAALGGGLELALSCDLRICGENATLGLPETGLAIIPGAGGTQRLPRIIGRSRAKELIFTGRRCDATEAVLMGLANYRVPAGEAYGTALELAREMTKKGPLGVRMAKKAIDRGMEVADMRSALAVEGECYEQLLHTQDRLEGLAAFAEKRKPVYTGA
ncbi:probable enoyl-CoA hydratase 2, mitochondrial [Triticum dicoccoides]|uniref:probable enoyl-CoA hydratase 2, mitochondrial n=1 Tax=Triticum dicoccoides TaxID=85692 RepID=UPI0018911E7F|nr:probable enoyl-CoA hydratase 2, mitochondrial [Triticum dicoccoides]XP_037447640.1 probable enoyl-CoA hydratase 2, mitochondrial [Triticum dicoccoides]